MGIVGERSIVRVTTKDGFKWEVECENRDEAFSLLLDFTKDIQYKEAVIVDYETGSEVIALRTIK